MVRHLAGVAEIVEDVPAAVAFYRDTFGFKIKQQMGDDYVVFDVPGILHFGVWSRAAAAEATFGDRAAADSVPLGYTDGVRSRRPRPGSRRSRRQPMSSSSNRPIPNPGARKPAALSPPAAASWDSPITPWARSLAQEVQAAPSDA